MEMMNHKHAKQLLHVRKDLTPGEIGSLEDHLEGCPDCRDYANFLRQLERELPASLPGVVFSKAELGRVSSIISSKMRGGKMSKPSFEGFQLIGWAAAAVLLVLALSWGIQNLMPQQPLPVGFSEQTGTPSPTVGERAETSLPYPPTAPDLDSTFTPTPTGGLPYSSAQDLSLTTADLGPGWHLDAEVTDLDERYFMERGEDGRAVIWTEQKGNPLWFDLESVETISMRGFSHPEGKMVLFQVVAVFENIAQLEAELQELVPVCDPPCEHRNEYSDGSGDISYYREISIGDQNTAGTIKDIADPHPPFISFIFFRKDRVLVTLFSTAQPDDPVNAPPVDEGRLEGIARIIEANIASAFITLSQEVVEPSPTPTPRPQPHPVRIEPSLTGERLSLAGWSPDGQWLVFWTVEPPDPGAAGFVEFIYRLRLYHPETGERCRYDEVTTTGYARMLDWHSDGRWGFQQDDRFLAALPCEDPEPASPGGFLTGDIPADMPISPDGRYQAVTVLTAEGRVQYLETSLIDLETGEAVELLHDGRSYTSLPWRIDLPVLYENFLYRSGEWLTDRIFLIRHTYDQGPLLLSPGEQVVQVSPELFGEPPGYQDAEGYSRFASGAPHPDGENFHLLLGTSGRDIEHLYLKLYHSETGEMEELPYRRAIAGGLFQDYLFLNPYPRETFYGYEHGGGIWVRPIDPPGSPGSVLVTNMDHFQVSPDLDRLVYSHDQNRITLISFPDGEIIHSWETHGYGPGWFSWSPDGSRIATSGQLQGSQEVGIFVIELD
jgi:hypothetical protein